MVLFVKKIRPFRLSDETVEKLDKLCGGNRTAWLERVIEGGGSLGVVLPERVVPELERKAREAGVTVGAAIEMAVGEWRGEVENDFVEATDNVRLVAGAIMGVKEEPKADGPNGLFRVSIEGEDHHVMPFHGKWGLFYAGGFGKSFVRHLGVAELEQLWQRRKR